MTREEYEQLLKSDYWKGYSYSLIKERNFICADCGQRFYNERHKLQVHHLVYRDKNPWSYKPEELVVLCEKCHKKRHGIWQEPKQESNAVSNQDIIGYYTKSYSYSFNNKEARPYNFDSCNGTENNNNTDDINYHKPFWKRTKFKYVLLGIVLLFAVSFGINEFYRKPINDQVLPQEFIEIPSKVDNSETKSQPTKGIKSSLKKTIDKNHKIPNNSYDDELGESTEINQTTVIAELQSENIDEINQGLEESVSTLNNKSVKSDEGLSTLEILEKRNHANVVKRAKEVGVSTEGSTIEILDRINHANVVKQME